MAVAADAAAPAVRPSLEEARELARDHNLIPLRHTFIADTETPVSAFLKLRGRHPETPGFLLESAEQGQRMGRYSFIGVRPRKVLRWSLGDAGDPYAIADAEVKRYSQAPLTDGPPFAGGAVGLFGYDLVRTVEPLGRPEPGRRRPARPGADAQRHPRRLRPPPAHAHDHRERVSGGRHRAQLRGRAGDDRRRPAGCSPARCPTSASASPGDPAHFESNMPREQFEGMVARIVEYAHAGDIFQVVPSQRWTAELGLHPFSVYRGLRTVNPSPYMYYLDFGDFHIAGASPEPLLTVSGRHASTRPIAGTRPRGATPEDDARIADDLLADPKERAEHVMLVDLGRNDLGRVCEYGTVKVDTFMGVETYSHVMHIVSNVSGTLRGDVGAMDALRSILPAGTLSGAPKVRAMQIIDELEPVKRGGYGGAIGWLSYAGDLDTCIHIRTVVVKDGVAHIQAGGGTVADAKPAYEFEESRAKSRAVLRAIALAEEQPMAVRGSS